MAYNIENIWSFDTLESTGVNKVPLNKVVFVKSNGLYYIKVKNTGITSVSTVQDAITQKALKVTDVVSKADLNDGLSLKIDKTEKGTNNGVAPLDSNNKIPYKHFPDGIGGGLGRDIQFAYNKWLIMDGIVYYGNYRRGSTYAHEHPSFNLVMGKLDKKIIDFKACYLEYKTQANHQSIHTLLLTENGELYSTYEYSGYNSVRFEFLTSNIKKIVGKNLFVTNDNRLCIYHQTSFIDSSNADIVGNIAVMKNLPFNVNDIVYAECEHNFIIVQTSNNKIYVSSSNSRFSYTNIDIPTEHLRKFYDITHKFKTGKRLKNIFNTSISNCLFILYESGELYYIENNKSDHVLISNNVSEAFEVVDTATIRAINSSYKERIIFFKEKRLYKYFLDTKSYELLSLTNNHQGKIKRLFHKSTDGLFSFIHHDLNRNNYVHNYDKFPMVVYELDNSAIHNSFITNQDEYKLTEIFKPVHKYLGMSLVTIFSLKGGDPNKRIAAYIQHLSTGISSDGDNANIIFEGN